MQISVEQLEKSQVKVSVSVDAAEMKPHLEAAAKRISETKNIPGFRPGKASVEAVQNTVGADALWNEAAEGALPRLLSQALVKEQLETVGHPYYDIEELKAGESLKFSATLSLIPEVKLGDYAAEKITKEKIEVTDEKVTKALQDLAKMRRSEALVDRAVVDGDKVDVWLEISQDGKVLDQQDLMPVTLGDKRFIKGFEEALVGLKKDDEKEFDLTFPADYYNTDLAGKEAHFKVKVLSVYELKTPEITDELAQAIGNFKTVDELKKHLRDNLEQEAKNMEQNQLENALLKKLVDTATYGEVPEFLINEEVKRLMREFEQSLAMQRITIEDHLKRINKSESELMLEFTPRALERVKTSLVLRQLVKDKGLSIDEKEYQAELDKLKQIYKDTPDMLKQLESKQHREYLGSNMLYKKVIEMLEKEMLTEQKEVQKQE